MSATHRIVRSAALACFGLAVAMAGAASAQTVDCGNAFYDDGESAGTAWFGGFQAGDPDKMFAVRFDLADFGYQPGKVEITGFCAGNGIGWGGIWPNQVFIYPDDNGMPDDSVTLGHGTILTGNGLGEWVVMLDEPVTLHGDFWLVNRGYQPLIDTDFNMDFDAVPDSGHSFVSETGIADLEPSVDGDYILRAYLQPTDRSYLTAGMAHASGANNSQWRSKMAVLNTSGSTAEVTLTYAHGSGTETRTVTLEADEMMAWDDVVVDLFGMTGESAGAIQVDGDGPLLVTARTFNVGDSGTFGQFLPGVSMSETMTSGQIGALSMIGNTSAVRTNVGFINLGEAQVQVRVTVFDASGLMLGARNLTIAPGTWKQQNDIFDAVGAGTVPDGYATVEVLTEGGTVWGYASVVDNATGDPTTIPLAIQ